MHCRQCGDVHPVDIMVCPRTQSSVLSGPCGSQVDRYSIESLLGRGGTGSVYRAKHSLLGRPVAIKLLRGEYGSNPDALRRFVREARIAATLGHPNVVRITDVGLVPEGGAFLVMDLLEGTDLRSAIREMRQLPVGRAADIALQMLAGLTVAHQVGVVHRDIKPANVFLSTLRPLNAPPRDHAILLDFGISKLSEDTFGKRITYTGALLGTPRYMAPEQFSDAREVDARADVYGVGVTLYHLLAGVPPFDGQSFDELLARVCAGRSTPLARVAGHVPPAVAAVVEQAMRVNKDHRYPSAVAMSDALRAAIPGLPPELTWSAAARPSQRPPAGAGPDLPPLPPLEPVATRVSAPRSETPMTRLMPSTPPGSGSHPQPQRPQQPVAKRSSLTSALLIGAVLIAGVAFVIASAVTAWLVTRSMGAGTSRRGWPTATPTTTPTRSGGATGPVASTSTAGSTSTIASPSTWPATVTSTSTAASNATSTSASASTSASTSAAASTSTSASAVALPGVESADEARPAAEAAPEDAGPGRHRRRRSLVPKRVE